VAVKTTDSPTQIVALLALITGGVPTFVTLTVAGDEAGLLHAPTVQVAVYEVVTVGLTVIEAPVWPFDHVTVPVQPDAVNTVDCPTHILELFAIIVGGVPTVMIFTVTGAEAGLEHAPTLQVAV
jgi:hypothetical protein